MIQSTNPLAAIAAVGRAFPPHYCDQSEVTAVVQRLWDRASNTEERINALHRNTRVRGRYLALPLADYVDLDSFSEANDTYVRVALDICETAVKQALTRADLAATDIDHIFFVSTTGVATPSLDARLVNRLGFRADVKRTPIFGLGCAGGAGGVARASDYLRAFPAHTALLVAVEICSLTLQLSDVSVPNMIATGLFGDAAAAVVLRGAETRREGPEVVASRSIFYPDTERVMGWDVSEAGFRIVLSADVPNVVRENLRRDADSFLADHGLTRADIGCFVCHPGGPRVIEALKEALEITDDDLALTWNTLEEVGNVSSASVLLVLGERLSEEHRPAPGTYGLMTAMGPGFASELVLLKW